MLYDQRWDAKTNPDVFSLESLIAWLEKQPRSKAYDYTMPGECLLAQYFSAMGFEHPRIMPGWLQHARSFEKTPPSFDAISIGRHEHVPSPGKAHDWKFGRALTRARAAQAAS